MRKTPYQHHVKSHIRNGHRVHDYERGMGKEPVQVAKPTVGNNQRQSKNFMVSVRYVGLATETIPITAPSIPDAIENAMLVRQNTEVPREVEVNTL